MTQYHISYHILSYRRP